MAKNEYGLDTDCIRKNLAILQRELDRYTPAEMHRALTSLADTCSSFAKCENCGGYNTTALNYDGSRRFCSDCDNIFALTRLTVRQE